MPLPGVHSIMMEKSAHPGTGGGVHAHPLSLYLLSRTIQRYSVRSSWEGRYTLPLYVLYVRTLCLLLSSSGKVGWGGGRARFDKVNIEKLKSRIEKSVESSQAESKHYSGRSSGKYVAWLRQDARVSSNVSQNLSVGKLENKNLCCNCRVLCS